MLINKNYIPTKQWEMFIISLTKSLALKHTLEMHFLFIDTRATCSFEGGLLFFLATLLYLKGAVIQCPLPTLFLVNQVTKHCEATCATVAVRFACLLSYGIYLCDGRCTLVSDVS